LRRKRFDWDLLPSRLLHVVGDSLGLSRATAASDLAGSYGSRPTDEFVRQNWIVIRDRWLPLAGESRQALVVELWNLGIGFADDYPTGRDAEMAFIRSCSNARRLRETVVALLVELGGSSSDAPATVNDIMPSSDRSARSSPPTSARTTPPDAKAAQPRSKGSTQVNESAQQQTIDIYDIANRLWETADELRANSHLKAAEYAIPVLGLIFLKFADSRFAQAEAALAGSSTGRREVGKANYQARGVLFLPEQARFANLLKLKEGDNLGKAINDAMARSRTRIRS